MRTRPLRWWLLVLIGFYLASVVVPGVAVAKKIQLRQDGETRSLRLIQPRWLPRPDSVVHETEAFPLLRGFDIVIASEETPEATVHRRILVHDGEAFLFGVPRPFMAADRAPDDTVLFFELLREHGIVIDAPDVAREVAMAFLSLRTPVGQRIVLHGADEIPTIDYYRDPAVHDSVHRRLRDMANAMAKVVRPPAVSEAPGEFVVWVFEWDTWHGVLLRQSSSTSAGSTRMCCWAFQPTPSRRTCGSASQWATNRKRLVCGDRI